jgi:ABC-type Fe3+-hydroxamate transport system substrate-binding protein
MRMVLASALAAVALAACGEGADKAVPNTEAPVAPEAPTMTAGSTVSTPADLQAACREAVRRLAGQEGETVQFRAGGSNSATMSWRAPVDGGRQTMTCTVGANGVELATDVGQVSVDASTIPAASAAQEEAR